MRRADEITAEAQRLSGSGGTASAPAAKVAASAAAAPKGKAEPRRPQDPGAGPLESVEIGGEKVASVTKFKGQTYVDLREFYVVRWCYHMQQKLEVTVLSSP